MASVLKRIMIGKPIASAEEHNQRLSKKVALPIFRPTPSRRRAT